MEGAVGVVKKRMWIWILAVVMTLGISGCGSSAQVMSTEEAEPYVTKARDAIKQVNDRDWEAILESANDTMREALTEEVIAKSEEVLDSYGEFVDFKEGKASKLEEQVVVVLPCAYSEKQVIYTVTFDQDGLLAGLYMK